MVRGTKCGFVLRAQRCHDPAQDTYHSYVKDNARFADRLLSNCTESSQKLLKMENVVPSELQTIT